MRTAWRALGAEAMSWKEAGRLDEPIRTCQARMGAGGGSRERDAGPAQASWALPRALRRPRCSGLRPLQPRLELIWADGAYAGSPLSSWAAEQGLRIEVVRREEGQQGFAVQPWRWVVERTFAWLGRSRRLAKDHERRLQSAEAIVKIAMIHLMLRRLARHA